MSAILVCSTNIKDLNGMLASLKEIGYPDEAYSVQEGGVVVLDVGNAVFYGRRFTFAPVSGSGPYAANFDEDHQHRPCIVPPGMYRTIMENGASFTSVVQQAHAAQAARKRMRAMGLRPREEVQGRELLLYADM